MHGTLRSWCHFAQVAGRLLLKMSSAAKSIPAVGAIKYSHSGPKLPEKSAEAVERAGLRLIPETGDSKAINTATNSPATAPTYFCREGTLEALWRIPNRTK